MKRIILLVTAVVLVSLSTGCTRMTGAGEKVGSVIKVSQEGLIFKTDEVEIVRGGMNGGSGAFSTTPLNGTVNDDALLAQLKDALNNQYEVKVWYRDYWTPLSSDSANRYIVAMERQKAPQGVQAAQLVTIDNPSITVQNGVITIKSKQ